MAYAEGSLAELIKPPVLALGDTSFVPPLAAETPPLCCLVGEGSKAWWLPDAAVLLGKVEVEEAEVVDARLPPDSSEDVLMPTTCRLRSPAPLAPM
jgi:hypothetical protein